MDMLDGVHIYVCPVCKQSFPDCSNSAPYKDGAPCFQCYMKEKRGENNEQVSEHSNTINQEKK